MALRLAEQLRKSDLAIRSLKRRLAEARGKLETDDASAIKIRELNYHIIHLKR